jgi:hypothetical protein
VSRCLAGSETRTAAGPTNDGPGVPWKSTLRRARRDYRRSIAEAIPVSPSITLLGGVNLRESGTSLLTPCRRIPRLWWHGVAGVLGHRQGPRALQSQDEWN